MDDIIKQGMLRKAPNPEGGRPLSGLLGKLESSKWYVLAVRSGKAYFESYDKEEEMFTGQSPRALDLSTCKQVTYTLSRATKTFTFCLVLTHKVVQLIASSRQQLLAWVSAIEGCLHKLGILQARDDKHIYSFCPAVVNAIGHSSTLEDVDDSVEGAVGGTDVDMEPVYTTSEDIPSVDEEGHNIFGTIKDTELKELRRKASFGDVDSMKILAQFNFDWTREPTSFPINETSTSTVTTGGDVDEFTGSCDFVDSSFWERNKVLDSEVFEGFFVNDESCDIKSNVNDGSETLDSDQDDGYCDLSELARVRGTSCLQSSENREIDNSQNNNLSQTAMKADVLTVNLLDSTYSMAASCSNGVFTNNSSDNKDKHLENDYAPFPMRPLVPDLISFQDISSDDDSKQVRPPAFQQPIQPLIKPRNMSRNNITVVDIGRSANQQRRRNVIAKSTNESPDAIVQSSNKNTASDSHSSNENTASDSHSSNENTASDSHSSNENTAIYSNRSNTNSNVNNLINQSEETLYQTEFSENFSQAVNTGFPRNLSPPTRNTTNQVTDAVDVALYEDIFDVKGSADDRVPLVPPRSDSLSIVNVPTKSTFHLPNVTSPTLDPQFSFGNVESTTMPPLPPRNQVKSEDVPPPIPERSLQSKRSITSGTSSDNILVGEDVNRVPQRQLSNRMRLDRSQSVHTVISLKQNQVEILKEEMLLPSIDVKISKRWFQGLALVDSFNSVWIAGWNLNDFARLHDKFHIGDVVLNVNHVPVHNSTTCYKQIKHSDSSIIEVTIKRLPKASVFVIRRSAEGESLGIKREGGTAEIVYVDPEGLAGNHHLPLKTRNMHEDNLCNWVITEVNSRTLNLFFKDMEIEHRLGAVGRDISLVVQPSHLIFDLKKNLKKIKNYKSFLIN